jgi:hypothetical protein
MNEQKQGVATLETVERAEFLRNPGPAFEAAEANGSVVISEADGSVHAIIAVPSDDRPIID